MPLSLYVVGRLYIFSSWVIAVVFSLFVVRLVSRGCFVCMLVVVSLRSVFLLSTILFGNCSGCCFSLYMLD